MSVPTLPVFSEGNVEPRGPRTPQWRQVLTLAHNIGQASAPTHGSPGFGNSAPAAQNVLRARSG